MSTWFPDKPEGRYRFERKFLVDDLSLPQLEMIIKLNPGFFTEVFHVRQINNIYFDSYELANYFENVDGQSRRTKVRIRWYEETFGHVNKPVLEFKIKSGLLGLKESFRMKPFEVNEAAFRKPLADFLEESGIPENVSIRLNDLQPTLLNRYKRRYFMSADRKLRLTLDWDLEFFRINSDSRQLTHSVKVPSRILELKYSFEDETSAIKVSNAFPFRLTKSSKYVEGINYLMQNQLFNK